jgi:two-component system OmpR family response regulator
VPSVEILLVEDDLRLGELICSYLSKHGYCVDHHATGQGAAERILARNPALAILDLTLPHTDGLQICRALRPGFQGRILILTARDEEIDEILGLELGADDFLVKPVEPRRLLARVRALLRRPEGSSAALHAMAVAYGQFRICAQARECTIAGAAVELTTGEFDLLWLLASRAGDTLSRDDILQSLRGIEFDGLDRSIDARIYRLRRKLGDDPTNPNRIKTVRGRGYLFSAKAWE